MEQTLWDKRGLLRGKYSVGGRGGAARQSSLKKEKRWEISDKSWFFYANHYTQLLFSHNSNRSQKTHRLKGLNARLLAAAP